MQYHNFKMYNDIKILNDNNINVYSIKTDALTIDKNDIKKVKKLLNITTELIIGGWRISKEDDIKYPSDNVKLLNNKWMKINLHNNNIRLDLIDEYDNNEICNKIKKYKQIIIRAEYGGSGKSYACAYMKNLNYNVLFVSPTNVLCKELTKSYDIKAVSLNKFFGFKIDGDTDKFNKFDSSSYDCIIFDEIYFYSVCNLSKVYNYIKNNKNKIILATGDVDQLEPIEDINNVKNYDEYKTECINKIFKYEIFLKENKRLSTDEDKEKLKNLKHDILKTDISVLNIINKYNLKTTNKIITDNNIAYTNKRCSIVSKQVRKKLNKKNDYEINEKLTCIKYFIHKGIKVNKNYEYIIIDIENNYITLKDEDENKLKLDLEYIKEHFIFSYCNTCHSRQGSTIKDTITIHEWNHIHASRKWLYTAITRTTHFDNVYFMVNNIEKENKPSESVIEKENKPVIENYDERKIKMIITDNINYYLMHDHKQGLITTTIQCNQWGDEKTIYNYNENKYINIECYKKFIGGCCSECNTELKYYYNEETESDVFNITVKKIDNLLPYHIDNIEPICYKCKEKYKVYKFDK